MLLILFSKSVVFIEVSFFNLAIKSSSIPAGIPESLLPFCNILFTSLVSVMLTPRALNFCAGVAFGFASNHSNAFLTLRYGP